MTTRRDAQQRLDALLSAMEPSVRKAIMAAWQAQNGSISITEFIRLLDEGKTEAALDLLRVNQAFLFPVNEAVRASLIAGGQLTAAGIPLKIRAKFGWGDNPRAQQWAQRSSSKMIERVDENLPVIREYIATAANEGVPNRKVALDIMGRVNRATGRREGGLLGLNSMQTEWAIKARHELHNLDKHYFTREARDKRYDPMVKRAIKAGKPLSQADLDKIAGRYNDRLLQKRGVAIARTETLNALRAGEFEGWQQAIEQGLIDKTRLRKQWLATKDGRTRDAHRDLDGDNVAFDGLFASPTGAFLAYPGDTEHGASGADLVQCRCGCLYILAKPNAR